jgi:predicted dehydrogenase
MSDTNKLSFGIIGAGLIGRKRALGMPSGCQVLSIFDPNLDRSAKLAGELSNCEVAVSLEGLLSNSSINAVIIATSHSSLATCALASLKAGKHVLIEKPGGISSGELLELQRLAIDNNLMISVGFNHRFHPGILKAKEIIESEKYGRLLWVRARYGHGGRIGYEKEWRADREISGGGELLDQGSHLIDLVKFFFGPSTLAFAHTPTLYWEMDVEDNAFIALEPKCGGFAWLHASWSEWKNTFSFEITLETAKIDIRGLGGSYGTEEVTLFEMLPEMGPPVATNWHFEESDNSFALEINDFISSTKGSIPIGATISDAISTLTIIEKAYANDYH